MDPVLNNNGLHQIYDHDDQIKVGEMMQREGVTLKIPDEKVLPEDTLIQGMFCRRELRKGLTLHGGDTTEEHAFTVNSTIDEGLSCIFFFKGDVGVTIGDQLFEFNHYNHNSMEVAAVIKTSQESFQRVTKQTQHVRYLVITATQEWLKTEALGDAHGDQLITELCNNHMKSLRWTPSPRLYKLISEILTPSAFMPSLLNLYLESRAVEVIAEVISNLMKTEPIEHKRMVLTRHENIRLQRAEEFISTNLSQPLNVEFIAHKAGISPSGLQRLFRQSKGKSVFEYIRNTRLEHALTVLQSQSVSVQEASAIAGYSNPANFATAFKRQFGMTPREAAMQSSYS